MKLLLRCLLLLLISSGALAAPAKNVILMIADGSGFNCYNAASYYQYGKLGSQVYDSFPVKLGCTTYSLGAGGYDPKKIWTDFQYARSATDSAAAATAFNTGVKTKNGKISKDQKNKNLVTFAQLADSKGKATGAVTSVEISHATPAAVWAHNESRYNYEQIANEIVYDTGLDVVMGAGHPRYNNDGDLLVNDAWDAKYCGGLDTYKDLAAATTKRDWVFIESKFDFQALANNRSPEFDRVLGLAQVNETLQMKRTDTDKLNDNVPALSTMTTAAINVLNKDKDGFYLMIEGGAVDWANHENNIERAIAEQVAFNKTVEAVVEKPRKFYVMGGQQSQAAMGSPAFSLDGKLVGIAAMRTGGDDGLGLSAMMSGGGIGIPIIVLSEDIKEAASQVPPYGAEPAVEETEATEPAESE